MEPLFPVWLSSISAFLPCILHTIEKPFFLEVLHSAAQQEITVAEYRPQLQKKRALASSSHTSSFTLLQGAGWVWGSHLTQEPQETSDVISSLRGSPVSKL